MKYEIIINPLSGGFNRNRIESIIGELRKRFTNVEPLYTDYSKHAEKLALESKADVIFVAGGDGLINEVINGLKKRQCIICPLPFGSANVLCYEYDIPLNPFKAIKNIDIHRLTRIYLGKIHNRYFAKMVGFGYDAMVVRNINYNVKKLNSKLAHVVSGLYTLIINNLKRVYIKINNIDVYAYNLIISLGRKYAGNYNLVKYPFYDGFTICTMESKKRMDIVKSLLSMLLKKGIFADIYLNKSITVYGANFCQLDGEYFALSDNKCEIELIKSDFYIPVYEN